MSRYPQTVAPPKQIKGLKKSHAEWEVREWVHCLVEAARIKKDPEKMAAAKIMAKSMAEEQKQKAAAIKSISG